MEWNFHSVVTVLLGVIFVVPGVIELAIWRKFIDKFVHWGYPRYWPIVTTLLKILSGILIIIPATSLIGIVLCAAICLAAAATLIIKDGFKDYVSFSILAVLSLLITASVLTR